MFTLGNLSVWLIQYNFIFLSFFFFSPFDCELFDPILEIYIAYYFFANDAASHIVLAVSFFLSFATCVHTNEFKYNNLLFPNKNNLLSNKFSTIAKGVY